MKYNLSKILIIYICICSGIQKLQAQTKSIILIADTGINAGYKKAKVNIFQENKIIKASLNEKIEVKSGIAFQIEFENKSIVIPGLKSLKIYSDTSIVLDFKSLQEVVIKSKKRIVAETLTGYTYYPQNDSIFKEKSILLALQRLPFISLDNENSLPRYKTGETKLLFLINGKQRKGLENTWVNVLRAIKAKQIYKVELIEDIPQLFRNQGYDVVINIHTLDANIYGENFNAAITGDQRNNINIDTRANFLRRKTDLGIEAVAYTNSNKGQIFTKIYENGTSIAENKTDNSFKYKHLHFSAAYGYRIDSVNDIAFTGRVEKAINNITYINTYSFPSGQSNSKNKLDYNSASINGSWVKRKTASITKSFSVAVNLNHRPEDNRLSFITPKDFDSVNRVNIQNELYWAAEYNILNTTNPNFQKEIGLQVYRKQTSQDYNLYNINPGNNKNADLLHSKPDTVLIKQFSIRPYYRFGKNISTTKRLAVIVSPEIYSIHVAQRQTLTYFLPRTRVSYKKILSDKLSVRNIFEFSFSKPSIDYLLPVIANTNPIETYTGNANIRPGKRFENTLEIVRRKKSNISISPGASYSFNDFDFFSQYDSVTKKMINTVNNGKTTKGLWVNLFYQFPFNKKINGSISSSLSWINSGNKIIGSSYSGIFVSGSCFFQYALGGSAGNLNFFCLINAKYNNGQGYRKQPLKYSLSYSNKISKYVSFSFTAENFLLKNITLRSYTYNEKYNRYTDNIQLYRLISLRFSYFFSNIKTAKYAAKKFTEIENEKSRDKQ